ncbi:hypothetical protein DH2020_007351 [Rehmannia glutinosa]|uniref:Uncharacterized protein n=1 Tax=Rehmannia glutinosa TaxID=99300 RepID=A0ABR0TY68_REHGL
MIMDVEIISVERIKPSIPTPNHLKEFNLSILDHLIPAAYAPIVVFYPNQNDANHFEILEKLKKSLSETLSRFFPLAGTIKDDFTIDCDDQGACFTTAKRKKKVVLPDFSAFSAFPADGSWLKDASMEMWGSLFKKGSFVTKRFVFDGLAIASLKNMAKNRLSGINPTRVETVSGFIWKCAMEAYEERFGYRKPSLITHLVNLRKRAAPDFPERKCVSKIDGEFVKKIRGDEGSETMHKCLKEIEEFGCKDVDHFGFTSWCNLGFYDVDFGFGKPVWVSSIDASGPFFMNLAILIDRRCGDGIEAWVTLDEQEMAILECNQEFINFASFNPSPLNIVKCDA